MTVSLSDVVFAFDMNRIESVGGVRYLYDYGPNGFNFAFPGGAADPIPDLSGGLVFDGDAYLSLPAGRLAEFYAKMPTGAYTWLLRFSGAGGVPFACWDGGNNGVIILQVGKALRFYQGQGGAMPYVGSPPAVDNRTYTITVTTETTPRFFSDQAVATVGWVGGAFGVTTYNVATVPRIGSYPAGLTFLTGTLKYLALVKNAVGSPDMLDLNRMIRDGGKVFCTR